MAGNHRGGVRLRLRRERAGEARRLAWGWWALRSASASRSGRRSAGCWPGAMRTHRRISPRPPLAVRRSQPARDPAGAVRAAGEPSRRPSDRAASGRAAARRSAKLLRERRPLALLAASTLLVTYSQSILESIFAIWALHRYGLGPRTVGTAAVRRRAAGAGHAGRVRAAAGAALRRGAASPSAVRCSTSPDSRRSAARATLRRRSSGLIAVRRRARRLQPERLRARLAAGARPRPRRGDGHLRRERESGAGAGARSPRARSIRAGSGPRRRFSSVRA